jgi:hypothetical protein
VTCIVHRHPSIQIPLSHGPCWFHAGNHPCTMASSLMLESTKKKSVPIARGPSVGGVGRLDSAIWFLECAGSPALDQGPCCAQQDRWPLCGNYTEEGTKSSSRA